MRPQLPPPNIIQAPYRYSHKKNMLGREGLVLHAISEYIHRDSLKWYGGYDKVAQTFKGKFLDEYDEWLHCLEFMSLVNLYAHYAINPSGDLVICKPNFVRAPHAGKSNWRDLQFLNNWYVGVEVMVKGKHDYGQFINAINNTDWCDPYQYHCINFLIQQLKQEELGCEEVIAHSECAGDDVRGKGKGKQDPGKGFKYELINGYTGNYA